MLLLKGSINRSHWLCDKGHRSMAARLLGSWVWNLLRARMFICCIVCCGGSGLCNELVTCSESFYGVCVCVSGIETSTVRWPGPNLCHRS